MATPPPPLRRATPLLLLAVLVGALASTTRADLVITRADRRVSTVLAPQISGAQLSSLSRLSTLGSNAARVLLLSLQADLTSRRLHPRFPRGLLLGFVCLVLFFYELFQPVELSTS